MLVHTKLLVLLLIAVLETLTPTKADAGGGIFRRHCQQICCPARTNCTNSDSNLADCSVPSAQSHGRLHEATAITGGRIALNVVPTVVENAEESAESQRAKAIESLENATTLSYTTTAYVQLPQGDAEQPEYGVFLRSETAHKLPGHYRETRFDKNGKVQLIELVDTSQNKSLLLNIERKTATWMMSPINVYGPGSPLEMLTDFARRLPPEPVKESLVDGKKCDVFRLERIDVWVDQESKQIVGMAIPGSDQFDPPETMSLHAEPPVSLRKQKTGQIRSKIAYGQELDDSLFQMTPPPGFIVVESGSGK